MHESYEQPKEGKESDTSAIRYKSVLGTYPTTYLVRTYVHTDTHTHAHTHMQLASFVCTMAGPAAGNRKQGDNDGGDVEQYMGQAVNSRIQRLTS